MPGQACAARWHDLDPNGHATNARLVEWLLDAAPAEAWRNFRPSAVSVRFAREVVAGETVSARICWDTAEAASRHALLGAVDGAAWAVAVARWAPLGNRGGGTTVV